MERSKNTASVRHKHIDKHILVVGIVYSFYTLLYCKKSCNSFTRIDIVLEIIDMVFALSLYLRGLFCAFVIMFIDKPCFWEFYFRHCIESKTLFNN